MKSHCLWSALLIVLPMSTLVGACGNDEDTDTRAALEREALEQDLELALEPDTTVQPELGDVALAADSVGPPLPPALVVAPAAPAPQVRRRTPVRTAPPPPETLPEETEDAPREPRPSVRSSRTAPSGTRFTVRMNEQLSTGSTSVGESFTATLAEAILDGNGDVVIPAGATVRGHVTESRRSGRAGEQPALRLVFDEISTSGRSYPIEGSVVGSVPTRRVRRDSRTEQAAKVAGGAAAGAVLGRVLGRNTRSTVGGAVIGAAAGTAVAVGTGQVDAVLAEGTIVDVELDGPVSVTP